MTCVASPVQGGVDSRDLYHDYIMVWIQDLQLTLLDLCKAEKVLLDYYIIHLFLKQSASPDDNFSGGFTLLIVTLLMEFPCRYLGLEYLPNIQPLLFPRKCLKRWQEC